MWATRSVVQACPPGQASYPRPLRFSLGHGRSMRALAAQGLAGELNALAVVDETVEDGIGVSGISDHLVPFIDRQLAGYDGGAAAVALFENLKQIVTRLGGERLKSPIVQDEQLDAGQGAEEPTIAAVAAGQLKIAEELRYSLIENGAVIAAGLGWLASSWARSIIAARRLAVPRTFFASQAK